MSIQLEDTQIHGCRPSDLPIQDNVDKTTLFAIQKDLSTYHTNYNDLSSDIKLSALNLINTGSMAFAEKWQYSAINHYHTNYSNVTVSVSYDQNNTLKIGTISVGNTGAEDLKFDNYSIIDIYCPVIEYYIPKEPAYGTLRFMYSQLNMPEINEEYINSDNFDGWVYPDGSEYIIKNLDQFKQYNVISKTGNKFVTNLGNNPFINSNKLKVPDLRDQFFKLNPFINYNNLGSSKRQCKFLNFQSHVAIPEHKHNIENINAVVKLKVDSSNCDFKLAPTFSMYDKNSVHYGKGSGEIVRYTADIKLNTCVLRLNTKNNIIYETPSSYPNHQSLPVMIYVGGRRKEYNKIYFS